MKKTLIIIFMALFMTTFSYADLPSDRPVVLILLGPPGAGKGTHAVPLSEKLQIPHISTGELFRQNLRDKTPLGLKVKTFMDAGKLVPDDFVLDMVFSRIREKDCEKGYILDGFPRSIIQAKSLQKRLKGKVHVVALNFNISDDLLVERITGRMMCKSCSTPYHRTFSPPKRAGICDHCEGTLYQRKDDNAETVKARLDVYHQETSPLIDYYDMQNVLYDINSEKTQREVFEEVMQTVEAIYLSQSADVEKSAKLALDTH